METFKHLKRALVVDDSHDMRTLVCFKLHELGLATYEAENGELAIDRLKHDVVDLIVTDFRMPVMNGVELLDWCRKNSVHIPVIFMSTDVHLIAPEQVALHDCCATLLLKPIDDHIFRAALKAADERTHHENCVHLNKGG